MKRFRDHAEDTARRIYATLGVEPTAAQRAAVVEMLEQQLVEDAVSTGQWCADHATGRSAIGSDAGRTLADELEREHEALITDLSALR